MEKKRVNWGELETHFLITIMRERNILNMLDGKRYRNSDIFQILEEELKKRGFLKSPLQIRTKWKSLKLQYYKAKRANSISGNNRVECPFWEELDDLLGHRPTCNVEGVDTSLNVLEPESTDVETGLGDEEIDASDQENAIAEELTAGPSTPSITKTNPQINQLNIQPNKQRKVVKKPGKTGYNEALKTFSNDLRESQKEVANYFLEKQAEIVQKEFEEQREWEKKLLEEDRQATERMMTNLMNSFFHNLRPFPQPHQFPFFNSSQAPINQNSVPLPYPSPLSPSEIIFPPFSPILNQSTPVPDVCNSDANEVNKKI